MNEIRIGFIIAIAIAYLVTPLVIKLATKVGAIDIPKDNRRVHKVPIPRLGGLAIFAGFLVAVLSTIRLDSKLIGILIGATIIVVMGYFDDKNPLRAKTKLLIQLLAAAVVVYSGVRIEFISKPLPFIFNYENDYFILKSLSYPVTIIWIVGVTNAINLVDGLDGLAAGVSVISALTLAVVGFSLGQDSAAILAIILAGSTLGFLPYNFNPAKIFMGDTGSLFLGYTLAVISVLGALKSTAALSILVPVLAIGFPIFDTVMAIIRRTLKGKSFMEADKGHLHHKLLDKGLTQKQAVLTLYSISAILGFGAIALAEATTNVGVILVLAVFCLASTGASYLGMISIGANKSNMDI